MFVLGIDIGTTSVKVALLDHSNGFKVLASSSERHSADVSLENHLYSEQNPQVICESLEKSVRDVLSSVNSEVSGKIKTIALCGQMHGCILWNPVPSSKDSLYYHSSNLITWKDRRCGVKFINSLPHPEKSIPLSTGYGCASLFWLQQNAAESKKKYKCSGTIMDYVIASLCKLQKPVMSTQNAMSWGYYNFCEESWNVGILQNNGFDVDLLPDIAPPNTTVGNLHEIWCGVPARTKVVVALGDMQCSVLSCQPAPLTGVFNLGTSAQLSTVSPLHYGKTYYEKKDNQSSLPESLICVPYFDDLCLWTSPSLNGGAVFEMFAKALYEWTKKFVPAVTLDEVYLKLQENANDADKPTGSEMRIYPTIFGERHAPTLKGSIHNISPVDISVGHVADKLAHGIIRNTFEMFSKGKEKVDFGDLTAVYGCGSPFVKNPYFREAMESIAGVPCMFDKSMDAAVGAAISVRHIG